MLIAALVGLTLPAAAVVIYTSLRPLWAGSSGTGDGTLGRTYRAIAIRVVLFVLALQALIVLNMTGVAWLRPIAPRAVVVLFGLFLITIGDALPRTRPNLLFGIRTERTLADRRLWMRLHRLAGYLAVAAGIAIAFSAVFFSKDGIAGVVSGSALGAAAALAIVYVASMPAVDATAANRINRRRQIAVWLLRVLLALAFFYFGVSKFAGGSRRMWIHLFETIGFGQWFRIFTGFVEAAGALLLLTPRGVLPGVALLGAAMIGALLVHIFVLGVSTATIAVAMLLAILTAVALASRLS